jgi:hypothetical protein
LLGDLTDEFAVGTHAIAMKWGHQQPSLAPVAIAVQHNQRLFPQQ